jgi:hypothetical protein
MSSSTSGMNDTLGNPLMIKSMDLVGRGSARMRYPWEATHSFASNLILEQGRTNLACLVVDNFQPVVDSGHLSAEVGCRVLTGVLVLLVSFQVSDLLVMSHSVNGAGGRVSDVANCICY